MSKSKCLRALTGTLALATAASAAAQSPARWTTADRERLEQREAAIFPSAAGTASSSKGLVSATASPIAVHAGVEVLRAGGTAADAAVATAFTQVTTMLGANVSFAGVAQLVYYDVRTRRVYAMDAGWNGWRSEKSPETIPSTDLSALTGAAVDASGASGRKTLVPGFMAGMSAMHARFGRLPFSRLLEPSIWYAKRGVPVSPLTAAYFSMATGSLSRTLEGRRFLTPDGVHRAKLGDHYASPQLVQLLERIESHGSSEMYRGRWAQHFVSAVNAAGGNATMADLADYRVRWTSPLSMHVGEIEVFAPGKTNTAACSMLAALNVLHHAALKKPYWEDPHSFRTTALALRLATVLGWSPEAGKAVQQQLGTGGDCASRLEPEFGASAAAKLEPLLGGNAPPAVGHHSASVVAIDRWGNVAALVHSSNTPLWGDTGLIVDGVPVPAPAGLYRDALTRMPAGGRVPSDMAPLIALSAGRPVFAVATIGSSEVQEAVRVMDGLIHHRADPATLLAAPPLLLNYEQLTGPLLARDELVPAGRYSQALLERVRSTGLSLREVDLQRTMTLRGTLALGSIGPDGVRESAEAPQVLAFAEAQ
jgi:gamma-glutamyltranspeptidase/glutathione hydrolase